MGVFDSGVRRILLVDLKPYDVSASSLVTKRVASEPYATQPSDSPANVIYHGVVQDDVFIDRSMFTGDNVGGPSIPDFGSLTINNPMQPDTGSQFDAWLDPSQFAWQGRGIDIHVLEDGTAFSTKTTVFSGVISELEYEENTIRFKLKSKAYLLDFPLQENRYTGAGGDEGAADLADKSKPLCFGRNANVSPVFVDTSALRYQYHDGAVSANNASRDKGAALTETTDYSNALAVGIIDLVAEADGDLTQDIQGSTLGASYSAKPADIMAYIAASLRGLTVNTSSVSAVNAARGYEIGYYTGSDNPTTPAALTDIAKTFNGYYGLNRAGEFDVGIFDSPSSTADISLTEADIVLDSLKRTALRDIVHKVVINFRPNNTVQNANSLAGGVTEANKALYGRDHQITVTAEDASVLTKYPEARELVIDTVIYNEANAQNLANSLLAYWKVPRAKFTLQTTNLTPLSVDINDVVKITHSRYNLSAGVNFSVIRFKEFYLQNRVELTVAG